MAEQDFERASRAAAAEQGRRDREQARLKEQQELQQRMAAHRQGVKAAKTRVDKAALHSLGEAFAARLQVPLLVVLMSWHKCLSLLPCSHLASELFPGSEGHVHLGMPTCGVLASVQSGCQAYAS